MPMNKAKKVEELAEIKDLVKDAEIILITENKGMSVKQVTELRRAVRSEGGRYKVTKNSLAKVAVKGTVFEQIADMFKGPVGIVVNKDPVAAAKAAQNFAKNNGDQFAIMGGAMGERRLDAASVKQLATLPSLDQLRGKLVGILQAPAQKLAAIAQAPAGQLARVVKAYSEKG